MTEIAKVVIVANLADVLTLVRWQDQRVWVRG
jgi:hypothetical protein